MESRQTEDMLYRPTGHAVYEPEKSSVRSKKHKERKRKRKKSHKHDRDESTTMEESLQVKTSVPDSVTEVEID